MNWKDLNSFSHTPYSGLPKSCIVESKSGKLYPGVRIENISYPLTIPAIQAGCAICLSEGQTPIKVFVPDENMDQLELWKNEFDLEIVVTSSPPDIKPGSLIQSDDEPIDTSTHLKNLLSKAITPNSDFPVSAILFTKKGYYEGVNIEICEWTSGICAERVALAKAISDGCSSYTRLEIHTLKGEFSSPCGACRQVMIEHLPFHDVVLHHADGTRSEHLTPDLLPYSFKSASLRKSSH